MENNNENKEVFNPYLNQNSEHSSKIQLNNIEEDEDNTSEVNNLSNASNKIVTVIKQNIYIAVMGIITIAVILASIFIVPKMFKNTEKENIAMSEKVNLTVSDLYISRFFDTSPDTTHKFQIKLKNESIADIFSQTIVTVWGKAICDIPSGDLISEEYVDARHFHVLDENGEETYDKYYILETSESVFSPDYNESLGKIIGVRYFIPNENWEKPANGAEELINNYSFYLDKDTPYYFYSNIEVTVSVKSQGKTERNAEWLTTSTNQIYSNSFDGVPLEYTSENVEETTMNIPEDNNSIVTSINSEETHINNETMVSDENNVAVPPIEDTPIETQISNETTITEFITEETTVSETEPLKIFPESMTINTGAVTLKVNETFQFLATLTPSNTTETTILWTSNNPNIATVSENGLVTAISAGTTTISITTVNGMSCDVKVTVEEPQDPNVVTSLMLDAASITMEAGQSYTLSLSVTPSTITSVTVTFVTSNSNVATVSSNGTITGVAPGTATITVTTDNGISSSCEVIVK